MLLIHGIPAETLRSWGHHVTEFEPKSTERPDINSGESSQGVDSWINAESGAVQTAAAECSTPASVSSGDEETILPRAVHYNTLLDECISDDTSIAHDPYSLDATTFPHYAVHLLPSEPNGTWRTQASYAMTSSSESAPTLQDLLKDYGPELDFPTLYDKLKEVAQDGKGDLESWINQKLAETDLSEIHDRIRRAVSILSIPNMGQFEKVLDQSVDTVTEVVQSSQEGRSESELLEDFKNDKYMFADTLSRTAQRALLEQGICEKWQLQCDRHVQLRHAMQTALLHTFTRIQQAYPDVPLSRAQPQWIAEREKKVWCLELDVGKVGVEVGPVTDRCLIELGPIDTGFELPESCGCAPMIDIDGKVQGVDDEWQILEA
jgi:hypothetical protein